jgi:hypothetical protein
MFYFLYNGPMYPSIVRSALSTYKSKTATWKNNHDRYPQRLLKKKKKKACSLAHGFYWLLCSILGVWLSLAFLLAWNIHTIDRSSHGFGVARRGSQSFSLRVSLWFFEYLKQKIRSMYGTHHSSCSAIYSRPRISVLIFIILKMHASFYYASDLYTYFFIPHHLFFLKLYVFCKWWVSIVEFVFVTLKYTAACTTS